MTTVELWAPAWQAWKISLVSASSWSVHDSGSSVEIGSWLGLKVSRWHEVFDVANTRSAVSFIVTYHWPTRNCSKASLFLPDLRNDFSICDVQSMLFFSVVASLTPLTTFYAVVVVVVYQKVNTLRFVLPTLSDQNIQNWVSQLSKCRRYGADGKACTGVIASTIMAPTSSTMWRITVLTIHLNILHQRCRWFICFRHGSVSWSKRDWHCTEWVW